MVRNIGPAQATSRTEETKGQRKELTSFLQPSEDQRERKLIAIVLGLVRALDRHR